jgi:hypothetical protein
MRLQKSLQRTRTCNDALFPKRTYHTTHLPFWSMKPAIKISLRYRKLNGKKELHISQSELLQTLLWSQYPREQLWLKKDKARWGWLSEWRGEICSLLLCVSAHADNCCWVNKFMWHVEQRQWNTYAYQPGNLVTCILLLFWVIIYW